MRQEQQHPLAPWTEDMAVRLYWTKRKEHRHQLRSKFSTLMRKKTESAEQLSRNSPTEDEEQVAYSSDTHSASSPAHNGLRLDGLQQLGATHQNQDGNADATEGAMSDNQYVWDSSGSREPSQPGEPSRSSVPSSDGVTNTVSKLFNMTGTKLESHLPSLLEKGPKFALVQNVTTKTLKDVEVGIERAMYALRWKLEIAQKRANLPPHAVHLSQTSPITTLPYPASHQQRLSVPWAS